MNSTTYRFTEKDIAIIRTALECQAAELAKARIEAGKQNDTASAYCFGQEIASIQRLLEVTL